MSFSQTFQISGLPTFKQDVTITIVIPANAGPSVQMSADFPIDYVSDKPSLPTIASQSAGRTVSPRRQSPMSEQPSSISTLMSMSKKSSSPGDKPYSPIALDTVVLPSINSFSAPMSREQLFRPGERMPSPRSQSGMTGQSLAEEVITSSPRMSSSSTRPAQTQSPRRMSLASPSLGTSSGQSSPNSLVALLTSPQMLSPRGSRSASPVSSTSISDEESEEEAPEMLPRMPIRTCGQAREIDNNPEPAKRVSISLTRMRSPTSSNY